MDLPLLALALAFVPFGLASFVAFPDKVLVALFVAEFSREMSEELVTGASAVESIEVVLGVGAVGGARELVGLASFSPVTLGPLLFQMI